MWRGSSSSAPKRLASTRQRSVPFAESGATVLKIQETSRHKSTDVLAGSPLPNAAAAQFFALSSARSDHVRTSDTIELAWATFRMTVRSIVLVRFVTLTAVAMVWDNILIIRKGAGTKPRTRSLTVINLSGLRWRG